MRILHTITGIAPNDGGPARSVPSLSEALGNLGLNSRIGTTFQNQSQNTESYAHSDTINRFPRAWPRVVGRSPQLAKFVADEAVDLIHHHGLWHRTLHYAWKKCKDDHIPLVVAPRGMLMPWARSRHSLRKSLAHRMLHPYALREVSGWHATSQAEVTAIRELNYHQPICLSPNGVIPPLPDTLQEGREFWMNLDPTLRDDRVALFYSRFHRKKRIIECMDAWQQVNPSGWKLLVIGIEDEFTAKELSDYAARMGGAKSGIRIHEGSQRPTPYGCADLFLLPSWSENFGIVVAEALAAGVPAIVTEGSPWSEIPTHDAGWFVPWSEFIETLDHATQLPSHELDAMGDRGQQWMVSDFSWKKSAKILADFYITLVNDRQR